jgi:hypothetical protein
VDGFLKIPVLSFSTIRFLPIAFEKVNKTMKTTQKDPNQLELIEGRHEQARRHQIHFPLLIPTRGKLAAEAEIQLYEGLKARHHQKLNAVIENLRKQADRMPTE